jgi:hypothetical protein
MVWCRVLDHIVPYLTQRDAELLVSRVVRFAGTQRAGALWLALDCVNPQLLSTLTAVRRPLRTVERQLPKWAVKRPEQWLKPLLTQAAGGRDPLALQVLQYGMQPFALLLLCLSYPLPSRCDR